MRERYTPKPVSDRLLDRIDTPTIVREYVLYGRAINQPELNEEAKRRLRDRRLDMLGEIRRDPLSEARLLAYDNALRDEICAKNKVVFDMNDHI